jgi:hypothetical protein
MDFASQNFAHLEKAFQEALQQQSYDEGFQNGFWTAMLCCGIFTLILFLATWERSSKEELTTSPLASLEPETIIQAERDGLIYDYYIEANFPEEKKLIVWQASMTEDSIRRSYRRVVDYSDDMFDNYLLLNNALYCFRLAHHNIKYYHVN